MTQTQLKSLSDDDLVAAYEQARARPRDPETRHLLRAMEYRASREGQIINSQTGVRYIWHDGQESLIRNVLRRKEHAQAICRAMGRTVRLARAERQRQA